MVVGQVFVSVSLFLHLGDENINFYLIESLPISNGKGKQQYLASAATEFGGQITRGSTLLIDDDPNNIKIAMNHETPAIWFDPSNPDR
jgi:hypothetical protein